jgi:hypothetical protein
VRGNVKPERATPAGEKWGEVRLDAFKVGNDLAMTIKAIVIGGGISV